MNYQSALNQYNSVDVESKVGMASSHELIMMMFDGIIKKLAIAQGATERNSVAEKGKVISDAIKIIDSLRSALDLEKGGELAKNLESLYTYMERRLLEANQNSDKEMLSEVSRLIAEIKEGWEGIPEQYRR